MRLFLLPISTRRALIYCERIAEETSKRSYVDKTTNWANTQWAKWERAESGWQKKLTVWGNQALKRIPYEEWGLKSIPPWSERRKAAIEQGTVKMELLYPGAFMPESKVPSVLKALATERQHHHRQKMWWSVVGMPISAPFALIPIIPNIPFFYLVFRAWSHWRALRGSQHLEYLVEHNLITHKQSKSLDEMYTAGLMYPSRKVSRESPYPTPEQIQSIADTIEKQTNGGSEDVMLLQKWNGKLVAERFKLPEMEVEIERAVSQVEKSIKAKEELQEEKKELEQATHAPEEQKARK